MIIVLIILLVIVIVWFLYPKLFIEYDRCMLIRLGDIDDANNYASVPIIVGRIPFVGIDNKVESDLNPRNVVGFVIDKPLWLDDVKGYKPGYFASCLISWEHINEVTRYAELGYGIRRISNFSESIPEGTRELCFIGFGTSCTPDKLGYAPCFVHIQRGLLAPFKYKPYARFNFMTPMKYRRWSLLTGIYVSIFKRKELKNAEY